MLHHQSCAPTASHVLKGSAQISRCPVLPSASNSLNLEMNFSAHPFPVSLFLNLPLPTTLTMPTFASTMNPSSASGKVSSAKLISSTSVMSSKYSPHPSLPANVFARNGIRDRDHSGSCLVIFGDYSDRSWEGGGGGGMRD